MRRRITLALATVVALSGCGDEPRLGESAAQGMHRDVDTVRTAARAGDRDGALRALDALARRVERQRDGGGLGDGRYRRPFPRPSRRRPKLPLPTTRRRARARAKGDKDKDEGHGGDD